MKHGNPWRLAGRGVLALVLLTMYAPVVMVFVYSFNESRIGSVWTRFSTGGYERLVQNRDLWKALAISVEVGLAASTASVALGTLAALGLRRWRRQTRMVAQGALALPLVVPDMIMAFSLAVFFHGLGTSKGLTTIVLAHTAFGLAYAYVVLAAAAEDLDETLVAAALDSGARPRQVFWLVTLPILAPIMAVAWLLVFALSFDDFLITFFTKGTGSDTLPIKVYSQMRFGVRAETNALFVVLFLVTLTCTLSAIAVNRRPPPR